MKCVAVAGVKSGAIRLSLGAVLAGALALAPLLSAQDTSASGARAVRLSYVDGQVQVSQNNTVLASRAVANMPLFEGTQISTADDGRAEIQFEDGSVARVSPNSSLTLAVLRQQGDGTDTQLVMNSGLGYFEIQADTPSDHNQLRFGDATVTTSGFSVLRVDVDQPPGELAVFSGSAHLDDGSSYSVDLHGGESVALNADPGSSTVSESIEPDSWDAWNSDRDQVLTSEQAEQTQATANQPNSANPAWNDLDANGNWYDVPGQGYVWSPYDAMNSGWDPYGCGDWMYTPGFNYTWVSCEPWGFLPYASGIWNFYPGFGWGWAPGGMPWWGTGNWGFNVGNAPNRYTPPLRPRGGPVHRPVSPIRPGGRYEPYPMLAVNRVKSGTYGQPVRVKGGPVTIAGNTVHALRPVSPRPVYPGGMAFRNSTAGRAGFVHYGFAESPGYGVSRGAFGNYGRVNGNPTRGPSTYGRYSYPASGGSYSGFRSSSRSGFGSGGSRGVGAPRPGGGGGASHGGSFGSSHGGGFGGGASHGGGGGGSHGGGGGGSHGGGGHH